MAEQRESSIGSSTQTENPSAINLLNFLLQVTVRVAGVPGLHSRHAQSLATVTEAVRIVQEIVTIQHPWVMETTVEDSALRPESARLLLTNVLVCFALGPDQTRMRVEKTNKSLLRWQQTFSSKRVEKMRAEKTLTQALVVNFDQLLYNSCSHLMRT